MSKHSKIRYLASLSRKTPFAHVENFCVGADIGLSEVSVEWVFSKLAISSPSIRDLLVMHAGNRLHAENYSRCIRHLGSSVAMLDVGKTRQHFEEGCSVVWRNVDHLIPPIRDVCAAISMSLGYPASTFANLYMSSDGRGVFGSHTDDHDVYAVQLAGTKLWDIDVKIGISGRIEANTSIGDVLYIRSGINHSVKKTSKGSIHLSLGVYPVDWERVINRAIHEAVIESLVKIPQSSDFLFSVEVMRLIFIKCINGELNYGDPSRSEVYFNYDKIASELYGSRTRLVLRLSQCIALTIRSETPYWRSPVPKNTDFRTNIANEIGFEMQRRHKSIAEEAQVESQKDPSE